MSKKRAISISLLVAVLMLVGKWVAYIITGSSSIFSDAAESVVHIAATAIAAYSLWYAEQPPDEDHPYGHGRISYFSAGFEGALILTASGAILYKAIQALIVGADLQRLDIGMSITGGLALVNLALGLYLVRKGRKTGSIVLESNGYHVLTDMWTSVGALGGVAAVHFTGLVWLDPVIAILLGLHIAAASWSLMRRSFRGLMDSVDEVSTASLLGQFQAAKDDGLISDFHQVRHRKIESALWVEAHVLLPGDLDLMEAHERVTRLEKHIREAFPDKRLHITTHMEPDDHELAHPEGHDTSDPYESR